MLCIVEAISTLWRRAGSPFLLVSYAPFPCTVSSFVAQDVTASQVWHPAGCRYAAGLGLPLCKMLTELHGGDFELESELGKGTTASIILPSERVVG